MVAFFGAAEAMLKPGEKWHHFRANQLSLERISRQSPVRRARLDLIDDSRDKNDAIARFFDAYVREVEEQLATELGKLFEAQLSNDSVAESGSAKQ